MAEIAAINQFKNFFNKLNLIQKIAIGGIVIGLLAGFVAILATTSSAPMALLYSSLDEQDAGKIVANLKENNIDYELRDNGSSILIDKDKVYDERLRLAGEGLPESSSVGYEIFDKTNLGMSEFVQKLNYRRALEGELSRTISSIDEIKKVRVHIVIPEKALFIKDQKPPTASITLILKSSRSVSKLSVGGIQNLVANSVEGMLPEHVTIVDQRGKILSEAPLDENSVAGLTATQYEQQRRIEQYYADNIKGMLDGILGYGNSEVHVNSELDFTRIEETITDFDPDGQVVRSEQTVAVASESADSLSYPYVNMAKDQSNVIANYEISKSVEHIIHSVGTIKRLTVAAMVNGSYKVIERDGEKVLEYTPRSEEEMQKLREMVRNAVGFDPKRNDQVSVINFAFDTSIQEYNLEDIYGKPWWKDPEIQKLILFVIAMLITIFIMYKLLRSKIVKERLRIAFSLPDHVTIEEEDIEEDEEELEEIVFDEDDLLLLPAELPEQLLLVSEKDDMFEDSSLDLEKEEGLDSESLAGMATADAGEGADMTEDALLKLEIKDKVETFLDEQTEEAVRLVKLLLTQDLDKAPW